MPRKSPSRSKAVVPRDTPPDTDTIRGAIDVPGLLKALEAHVLKEAALSTTQEMALAAVMGVVNLVLRFVTKDPITITPGANTSA